jgi:hypothetical protein
MPQPSANFQQKYVYQMPQGGHRIRVRCAGGNHTGKGNMMKKLLTVSLLIAFAAPILGSSAYAGPRGGGNSQGNNAQGQQGGNFQGSNAQGQQGGNSQ